MVPTPAQTDIQAALIEAGAVENKYFRWYLAIVSRPDSGVETERHHAIPRALGGARDHIVRLSYRKHFLSHWLLTKCTGGAARKSMCFALMQMVRGSGLTDRNPASWQYAAAKSAMREAMLGNKNCVGKQNTLGKVFGPDTREKVRAASTGRRHSEETKAKLRLAKIGNRHGLGHRHSAESRELMSKNRRGKPSWFAGKRHSAEARQKISQAARRREEAKRASR